jgi:hypothetical protein
VPATAAVNFQAKNIAPEVGIGAQLHHQEVCNRGEKWSQQPSASAYDAAAKLLLESNQLLMGDQGMIEHLPFSIDLGRMYICNVPLLKRFSKP